MKRTIDEVLQFINADIEYFQYILDDPMAKEIKSTIEARLEVFKEIKDFIENNNDQSA